MSVYVYIYVCVCMCVCVCVCLSFCIYTYESYLPLFSIICFKNIIDGFFVAIIPSLKEVSKVQIRVLVLNKWFISYELPFTINRYLKKMFDGIHMIIYL